MGTQCTSRLRDWRFQISLAAAPPNKSQKKNPFVFGDAIAGGKGFNNINYCLMRERSLQWEVIKKEITRDKQAVATTMRLTSFETGRLVLPPFPPLQRNHIQNVKHIRFLNTPKTKDLV